MRRPWKGSETFEDPLPKTPTVLATIEDFELRHGPLDDADKPLVTALLSDASALVEAELNDFPDGWSGEKAVVPAIVTAVCVQVSYRAWTNPDGIASEQLGEHSRTYRGASDADSLWLTENEKKLIRRAAGISRTTSIQVESPYPCDPGREASRLDFWPIDG